MICAPGYTLDAGRCVPHTGPAATLPSAVWAAVAVVVVLGVFGVLVWRWR